MCLSRLVIALLFATAAAAQVSASLEDLARRYLIDLIRLDTTNRLEMKRASHSI